MPTAECEVLVSLSWIQGPLAAHFTKLSVARFSQISTQWGHPWPTYEIFRTISSVYNTAKLSLPFDPAVCGRLSGQVKLGPPWRQCNERWWPGRLILIRVLERALMWLVTWADPEGSEVTEPTRLTVNPNRGNQQVSPAASWSSLLESYQLTLMIAIQ